MPTIRYERVLFVGRCVLSARVTDGMDGTMGTHPEARKILDMAIDRSPPASNPSVDSSRSKSGVLPTEALRHQVARAPTLGSPSQNPTPDSLRTWRPMNHASDVAQLMDQAKKILDAGLIWRAADVCRSVLRLAPDHAQAHHLLGTILCQVGRRREGLEFLRRALTTSPKDGDLWLDFAQVLIDDHQFLLARSALDEALRYLPASIPVRFLQARCLSELGHPGLALKILDDLAQEVPSTSSHALPVATKRLDVMMSSIVNQLGFQQSDEFPQSLTWPRFDRAISKELSNHPHSVELLVIKARSLLYQGEIQEAEQCLRDLLARPGVGDSERCDIRYHLGRIHDQLGHFDISHRHYLRSIDQENPDPKHLLACAESMLRKGRYREGWGLYESRIRCGVAQLTPPASGLRRWTGQNISGETLVVVGDRSTRDVIRDVRFLEELRGRDIFVVVQVPASLVGLVSAMAVADIVVALDDPLPATVLARGGWYELLGSLPLRLGIFDPQCGTAKAGPDRPYRYISQTAPPPLRLTTDSAVINVGIAWRTDDSVNLPDSALKEDSIPTSLVKSLLGGVLPHPLLSLQHGAAGMELADERTDADFFDISAYMKDAVGAVSMLAQLDMLITVDNALAHLAGALGIKALVLLPVGSRWVWSSDSDQTGWYPSLRLIRRAGPNDWPRVLALVCEEIRQLYRERSGAYLAQIREGMVGSYQRHDLPEARKALDVILRAIPEDFEANHLEAIIAAQEGRHETAGRFFFEALRLAIKQGVEASRLNEVIANASLCFDRSGNVQAFVQLMNFLFDNKIVSDRVLVRALLHVQLSSDRWRLVRQALDLNPDSLPALYARGCLELEAGNMTQARRDLEAVFRRVPNDPRVQSRLAVVLSKTGFLKRAVELITAANLAELADLDIAMYCYAILKQDGQQDQAIEVLRRSLGSLPEDQDDDENETRINATITLVQQQMERRRYEELPSYLRWLTKVAPYRTEVQLLQKEAKTLMQGISFESP